MHKLPPGQRARDDFPRFGLSKFAKRFPQQTDTISIIVTDSRTLGQVGNGEKEVDIGPQISALKRIEQTSDFHCVTTWSSTDLNWSGYRFSEVYGALIKPLLPDSQSQEEAGTASLQFRSQDGYRSCMLLEDLLADNVLLADQLNGQPLGIEHGGPIRLVAPEHYGYMNAKHIKAIEYLPDNNTFKPPTLRFMYHPRARVAMEERGRGLPGWLLRRLYGPLVKPTVKEFANALKAHRNSASSE